MASVHQIKVRVVLLQKWISYMSPTHRTHHTTDKGKGRRPEISHSSGAETAARFDPQRNSLRSDMYYDDTSQTSGSFYPREDYGVNSVIPQSDFLAYNNVSPDSMIAGPSDVSRPLTSSDLPPYGQSLATSDGRQIPFTRHFYYKPRQFCWTTLDDNNQKVKRYFTTDKPAAIENRLGLKKKTVTTGKEWREITGTGKPLPIGNTELILSERFAFLDPDNHLHVTDTLNQFVKNFGKTQKLNLGALGKLWKDGTIHKQWQKPDTAILEALQEQGIDLHEQRKYEKRAESYEREVTLYGYNCHLFKPPRYFRILDETGTPQSYMTDNTAELEHFCNLRPDSLASNTRRWWEETDPEVLQSIIQDRQTKYVLSRWFAFQNPSGEIRVTDNITLFAAAKELEPGAMRSIWNEKSNNVQHKGWMRPDIATLRQIQSSGIRLKGIVDEDVVPASMDLDESTQQPWWFPYDNENMSAISRAFGASGIYGSDVTGLPEPMEYTLNMELDEPGGDFPQPFEQHPSSGILNPNAYELTGDLPLNTDTARVFEELPVLSPSLLPPLGTFLVTGDGRQIPFIKHFYNPLRQFRQVDCDEDGKLVCSYYTTDEITLIEEKLSLGGNTLTNRRNGWDELVGASQVIPIEQTTQFFSSRVAFFDPQGLLHVTDNMTQFATEKSLTRSSLSVLWKDGKPYKGWQKPDNTVLDALQAEGIDLYVPAERSNLTQTSDHRFPLVGGSSKMTWHCYSSRPMRFYEIQTGEGTQFCATNSNSALESYYGLSPNDLHGSDTSWKRNVTDPREQGRILQDTRTIIILSPVYALTNSETKQTWLIDNISNFADAFDLRMSSLDSVWNKGRDDHKHWERPDQAIIDLIQADGFTLRPTGPEKKATSRNSTAGSSRPSDFGARRALKEIVRKKRRQA